MIKNILTVGDSFTYGEELEDILDAYPYQLSRLMGNNTKVNNLSKPGSGNRRMVRTIIEFISHKNPVDLVIVGWSSPGRLEFADASGPFDIWPGYMGNMFHASGQLWRLDLLEYINEHHNTSWIYQQHLLDTIMLQEFLKRTGIKYIMLRTVGNEYYHNSHYLQYDHLTKLIDQTNYLGWPSEGMAEWTQGCKKGPNGHFLKNGHTQVTNKLYEHIRNLGWLP
jgi:hypothetical protein